MKSAYQFRLRTLFVLTAVVAVVLGLYARSKRLEGMARFHTAQRREMEERYRSIILDAAKTWRPEYGAAGRWRGVVFLPEDRAKIKQCETLAAYHVEAADCYRRGAESPWLPVWLPKAPAETPP